MMIVYMYIYIHIDLYVCMSVIYMYICICTHAHERMQHTPIHLYRDVYTHMHAYTHRERGERAMYAKNAEASSP